MTERNKHQPQSEELSEEVKTYLGKIHLVLRYNQYALSQAGMTLGRSRLGRVNEICLDSLRSLVGDDDFLRQQKPPDEDMHPYEFMDFIESELQAGLLEAPKNPLTAEQVRILTKMRVFLEWGWQVANEKGEHLFSLADHPIGKLTKIAKDLLAPLVPEEEFKPEFGEFQKDPNGYYQEFRFEVNEKLYPLPGEI